MRGLDREFCFKIARARVAAGLSQSALARELGCKQPQISMFEQGDGTKLNDEVINRLADKFGIPLPQESGRAAAGEIPAVLHPLSVTPSRGFCPNPHCPTNHAYEVAGRVLMRPDREAADPVGGKFCAGCGEVLEKVCPNCGSPLHDGAVCSFCGKPYIALGE